MLRKSPSQGFYYCKIFLFIVPKSSNHLAFSGVFIYNMKINESGVFYADTNLP